MATGDEDKLKGAWNKAKGRAKKAWAELTEDDRKKREGQADKARGVLEDIKGDIKKDIADKP